MNHSISTNALRAGLAAVVAVVLVGATPAGAQARSGMTWLKVDHDSSYGADHVGCYGCDSDVGDTSCSTALPILCIKMDSSTNPGISTSYYEGWIGGNIALTPPIQGTSLASIANANLICRIFHGFGWQMAEFHHPAGEWSWWSYGNISDEGRFWVYMNSQPANCWN